MEQTITTETMQITKLEGKGMVAGTLLKGVRPTLETEIKNIDIVIGMAQGEKVRFIVDIQGAKSFPKDAREYISSSKTVRDNFAGAAVMVGSGISRILGNFFIGFNKPPVPTKLFSDREKAMEWLKSL